jgi:hypothetical protein
MKTIDDVPILIRREIEARMAGPLVQAMAEALGDVKAKEVLTGIIDRLAFSAGQDLARRTGGTTLEHFAQGLEAWKAGGAIEVEEKVRTDTEFRYDVTRCEYARMYRQLGLEDLGAILSCRRDFALMDGFNPELTYSRTQTLMEGADRCDVRITRKPADPAKE